MKYKILAVDDEPANLRMLDRVLKEQFEVFCAGSGPEGLEVLAVHDVALIIADQRMPEMSGLDFLKRAAEIRPHCVRIIISGYTDDNDFAAALNSNIVYRFVMKPWVNADLLHTVKRALSHHETIKAQHQLNLENLRLRNRLSSAESIVERLFKALLNAVSPDAEQHGSRTRRSAEEIGRALTMEPTALERLSFAAYVHDVANAGIAERVASHGESVTGEGFVASKPVEAHALELFTGSVGMDEVALTLRYQNEHYDGTGSPGELSGSQIPLNSRILAVACAFEKAKRIEGEAAALEMLQRGSGARFDPELVTIIRGLRSLSEIRLATNGNVLR